MLPHQNTLRGPRRSRSATAGARPVRSSLRHPSGPAVWVAAHRQRQVLQGGLPPLQQWQQAAGPHQSRHHPARNPVSCDMQVGLTAADHCLDKRWARGQPHNRIALQSLHGLCKGGKYVIRLALTVMLLPASQDARLALRSDIARPAGCSICSMNTASAAGVGWSNVTVAGSSMAKAWLSAFLSSTAPVPGRWHGQLGSRRLMSSGNYSGVIKFKYPTKLFVRPHSYCEHVPHVTRHPS